MRSFALTFATLFFGAVCSARPTLPVVDSVANVAGSALAAVTNVVPRGDVRGITVILTEAKGKLLPLAQQIGKPHFPFRRRRLILYDYHQPL